MTLQPLYYFIILFLLGILGLIVNRTNIILLLMSVEVMLLAINLCFGFCSLILDDLIGQAIVLFVLTVAAAESSIGLAILVVFYRVRSNIDIKNTSVLRGLNSFETLINY